MVLLSLEELTEAHSKSQRLLESLLQIPSLLADEEAWASQKRGLFALLRRGFVDCITNGCLEAPIFGNRQIEDAFLFLLTLGLRSERRRQNVLLCFRCLRDSESWSMALRGSRRVLELLKELPEEFRDEVLDAAGAAELLLLLGQKKKKKKKSAKTEGAGATDEAPTVPAPVTLEPPELDAPVPQEDACDVEVSEVFVSASRTCPEDFLAENSHSLSISDSSTSLMPRASYTCPEDLLTEPSLSIHSPEPLEPAEVPKPPSPALPREAVDRRPPRPEPQQAAIWAPPTPTPTRQRNFGGWVQESPASKPRRPGDARRKKDFEELGPRCPNGKPMTRELMIKEGQKRRNSEGSRTPSLRRFLSRGGSSPQSGADTPSGLIGRMKQLLPTRAPSPASASRPTVPGRIRDFGGDRFGVVLGGQKD